MIELNTVALGIILSVLGIGLTVYNIIKGNFKDVKKETKETTIDSTTMIVKLDNIQISINQLNEAVRSIQSKIEGLDHRLTVVETKLALGMVNPLDLK